MQRIFLLLFAATFLIFSCDPDTDAEKEGSVKLNFKATYQGEPLVMLDQIYAYPDGTPIKFQLFNYYVADVILKKNGETTGQQISEVATIDYGNVYDVATAQAGIDLISEKNITPGTYDRIEMGIGLSPALNATQPGDYSAGHPLTDNYWSWATGYVFAKIEASADLDGDGVFTDKITYHIGKDDLYTRLTLDKQIVVAADGTAELDVTVDLYDVLQKEGEFVDISVVENTQDHTNDEALYRFLWTNLTEAFSFQ
jgi:hypothetical protein